jgi:magnesium-transporting ATPase (P-type)
LKQADIGVAMGINGTDVAKEAADIVLIDDNFATIEKAVEEGRGVFDNLIKFILWTLPISFAEAFLVMIAIFLNLTIPISPVQILWINMVTTILLGTMFSFEPIDKSIMKQKPRNNSNSILSRGVSYRIISVMILMTLLGFVSFYVSQKLGADVLQSRTVVVNSLVFMGITFMFSCRSFRLSVFKTGFKGNKYMLLGASLMVLLQILFTTTFIFQKAFKTVSLTLCEWYIVLLCSLILLTMIEVEKLLIRRKKIKKNR